MNEEIKIKCMRVDKHNLASGIAYVVVGGIIGTSTMTTWFMDKMPFWIMILSSIVSGIIIYEGTIDISESFIITND